MWFTGLSMIWLWSPFQVDDAPSLLIITLHKVGIWPILKTLYVLSRHRHFYVLFPSVHTLELTSNHLGFYRNLSSSRECSPVQLMSLKFDVFKHYLLHKTHTFIMNSFFMLCLPLVLFEAVAQSGVRAKTSNERTEKNGEISCKFTILVSSRLY